MSPDAIAQIILSLWMTATGLLLVRLLYLRLHQQQLLFTISSAINLVFGVGTLLVGFNSTGAANLGLLGDTMDIFLTPSVALELYGMQGMFESYPPRLITPVVITILAGLGINLFLLSNPDTDSFQSAAVLAFMADTLVTILVISYVVRRVRQTDAVVDRNTTWMRRLFAIELIGSGIRSLAAAFLPVAQFGILDILFFGTCLVATITCAFALRRAAETSAV